MDLTDAVEALARARYEDDLRSPGPWTAQWQPWDETSATVRDSWREVVTPLVAVVAPIIAEHVWPGEHCPECGAAAVGRYEPSMPVPEYRCVRDECGWSS